MHAFNTALAVMATLYTTAVIASPYNSTLVRRDQGWSVQAYSTTDCSDAGVTIGGDNNSLDPADISRANWGQFLGGLRVLQWSTDGDSMYIDDQRFIYVGLCGCSDGQIADFTHCGDDGSCYPVNADIGSVGVGITACDAAGFDNIYKEK